MPFDKLDIKAREAAEQYNAAYSEEAWSKMEALLNKHMPQAVTQPEIKKERKFHEKWLFLLLSLMAVSFIILLIKPWKNNGRNNVLVENTAIIKPAESDAENKSITLKPNQDLNADHKSTQSNYSINKPAGENLNFSKSNVKGNPNAYSKDARVDKDLIAHKTNIDKNTVNESGDIQINKGSIEVVESQDTYLQEEFINQKITNRIIGTKNIISDNILIAEALKVDKTKNAKAKNPYNTKKNKFANYFSLSLSAGPDVSAININNIGTFEILYGAGIGYKFGKRWQVRTGFYTARKVYNAKPSNYNPPSQFWNYYPQLEAIGADCKVNEIPLILNYTFRQNSKQAWFGSAGISSYFMKRETYNYLSKTSTGYQNKSYTIYRQNKHYLSSLRISAGYEKTLNKTVSLTAEPYLNLPLSGIGYGKVKLNSAGLLFSVNVKPFAKN